MKHTKQLSTEDGPAETLRSGVWFAVRFFAKEAKAESGSTITKEDEAHWLTDQLDGWVPATSQRVRSGNLPKDIKVFDSEDDANAFMREWGGHPWYAVPKAWETVRVTGKYERVFTGFDLANT
jgi:hypothetical protein